MHSSAFMTPIEAVLLITKNSQWLSSTKMLVEVAHKREVLVEAATPMISLRDLEPSLHQEELEASLVSASNSELWTTITVDHLISTSSLRQ